ncbi:NAD(P)-dependent oxidoreductase [Kamptonema cortianum]|nr:NAD(P)-dependent oxidoreductase [Geitlerinema splendidum]MDK3155278.1 NAD(P)-dependent oxidoreductase [Kamptonema cortianum]
MRVQLLHDLKDDELSWLRTTVSGVEILSPAQANDDAEILVAGTPSAEELDRLPSLKHLIVPWAGVAPRTLELLRGRRHICCYNLHHNAEATAETALALLFAVSRRIVKLDKSMRAGNWAPRYTGSGTRQLAGKSALIVGYGSIGQRVGAVLSTLGMQVTGVNRSGRQVGGSVRVVPIDRITEHLSEADVVILALPLTEETLLLFNRDLIQQLKDGSIFVNVARGAIVEEAALFEAVQSGKLFGAGFDVWWKYPAEGEESDSPVGDFSWHELENVVMSPHVGGTSEENESLRLRGIADLIQRIRDSDEALRAVDVDLGY